MKSHALIVWFGITVTLILLVASGCGPSDAAGDSEETLISEGGRIAFTRLTSFEESDLEAEVYAINVDGSGEKRLTDSPGLDGFPTWSPNGGQIAFTSDRHGGNWEIYVMNADGSKQTRLTNTPEDEAGAAFSPNGKKIAFVFEANGDDPSIWVMDADGSGRMQLASGNWPSWSPDSRRIVYTSGQWNDPRISLVNADGSEQRTLDVRGASQPAFSPNGEKIAYVADVGPDKDTWDNEEVFVMNPDGSGRTRLTDIPGNDHWPPAWSPDGTRIAFTSDGAGQDGEIQVINADGSGLTTLTDGWDYDAFPAWRP
jgi:Tol biopolymer transport system component